MRLSKKQAKTIAKSYNLGKVKSIKLIPRGIINDNYLLKTDKGKFIIRILRRKVTKDLINLKNIEFKILKYLKKRKFPYQIPHPLKNKQGEYLSKISKRTFWVYGRVPGRHVKHINTNKFKEIAKAIALFHKYIQGFKVPTKKNEISSINWLTDKYNKMKKVKPRTRVDKYMLNHIDFMDNVLKKIVKMRFKGKFIPVHTDFHTHNLLFSKDKLVGILDFDNLGFSLKVKDVSHAIQETCLVKRRLNKKKMKFFIKEYSKYNSLSKREIDMIVPLILRYALINSWWAYTELEKRKDLRYTILKNDFEVSKNLVEDYLGYLED